MPRRLAFVVLISALAGSPLGAQSPAAGSWLDPGPLPIGARLRLGGGSAFQAEYNQAAALSPDGKHLAVADSMAGGVSLVELASGKQLARLNNPNGILGFMPLLDFSADGKVLAFGSFRSIIVAAVPSGKVLRQIDMQNGFPLNRQRALSLSGDGALVALGTDMGGGNQQRPFVWDVATGRQFGPFDVIQNAGVWAVLSPDGKVLATGGQHFARGGVPEPDPPLTIQLWDVQTAKELRRFKIDQPLTQIMSVAFSPDGKTLAVASGQSTFHLLDVATGQELRRSGGRRSNGTFLKYSPHGKLLVAAGLDGAVQAWEVEGMRRINITPGPRAHVLDVAFRAENRPLALGRLGQALVWWDVVSGVPEYMPQGHVLPISSLAFADGGKTVVSASLDGRCIYWDAASGREVRSLYLWDEEQQRLGGGVRHNSVALSADAHYAAANGAWGNNMVRLWDMTTGRAVCDFEANRAANFSGLAFSPRGDRLAAAGASHGGNVWDTSTGQEVARLSYLTKNQNAGGGIPRVAVSPDGALVAVPTMWFEQNPGRQMSAVLLLDGANGKELLSVPAANTFNLQAAFSPDGKLLALAGQGLPVTLLKAPSGKEWLTLNQGAAQNFQMRTALTFAPDGRTLAVAMQGQQVFDPTGRMMRFGAPSVEIWEIASGGRRLSFQGHRANVNCLQFSPDGQTLASGSHDTTVLLWDTTARPRSPASAPSAKELAEAWSALAGADAQAAFRAMGRLLGAPAETVALLKEHMRPVPSNEADRAKIQRWLIDLDSDNFGRRDEAYRGLERLGAAAEPALRKAQQGNNSLEVRRRLEDLLARLERGIPGARELQALRGLEVLEHLGTAPAHELLAALAGGDGTALLTQEARKALARLQR